MSLTRWFMLGLALTLGLTLVALLLVVPGTGTVEARPQQIVGTAPSLTVVTTSASSRAAVGPASVSGSSVTTGNCYEPGQTQVLCFTVYNGSPDAEWLDAVTMTFPTLAGNWSVSCQSQDTVDSSGNPVNLTCHNSFDYELFYRDDDTEVPTAIGEITAGSSWGFCVQVTIPPEYNGPRFVTWGVSGDEEPGSTLPHDATGTLAIEQCTPLMLKPDTLIVEGCNGITQSHTFELWNNTGTPGTFDLLYDVTSGNATFAGPTSLPLQAGEVVTFVAALRPELCVTAGERVTATLQASGNGQIDTSTVVQTITDLAGWSTEQETISPSMDSAVVWASEVDGGLWAIGGYGSNGATQRYDPNTDTWTTHEPETAITPSIEYPMDGCYGLNDVGHEVVVLFPDTIVTGSLHIYDITSDNWYTEPVPEFYPDEGRWGQDIVSLLNLPDNVVDPGLEDNVCYLTGGSTQTGGGRTQDLWVYYPGEVSGNYLGPYSMVITGFNFHAAWYVPWVGNQGAICVGGGIDHESGPNVHTQCYDLQAGSFRARDMDLGLLPEPWWGMADGWQIDNGRYQIWIANGVAQNGSLLPFSAYADATTGGFVPGPGLPVDLYRLEGDGVNGRFYVVQGAAGGFNATRYSQSLVPCPSCATYLPAVLRAYGP